jgi:hypothetical protein
MDEFENAVYSIETNVERFNEFIPSKEMSLNSLNVDELERLISFVSPKKDLVASKRRPELIPLEELVDLMSSVTFDPSKMIEFLMKPKNKTEKRKIDWLTSCLFHKSDMVYPTTKPIEEDYSSELRVELNKHI